jgi:hypothetical protein
MLFFVFSQIAFAGMSLTGTQGNAAVFLEVFMQTVDFNTPALIQYRYGFLKIIR